MKRIFVLTAALAAVLAGCGGAATTESDNGVAILAMGPHSAVKKQSAEDIHDQAAFKELWDKTYADDSHPPAMPTVDFTKNAVVAYYLGEMKHGGFQIRIDKAQLDPATPGTYDVDFQVTVPGQSCHNMTNDITHPYLIATVPSGSATISFDVQQRALPPCN